MNKTRKLALKRERLTELSNDQLDGLAGGLAAAIIITPTHAGVTCGCPSDNYDCPSLDIQCVDTYRHVCGNIKVNLAAN